MLDCIIRYYNLNQTYNFKGKKGYIRHDLSIKQLVIKAPNNFEILVWSNISPYHRERVRELIIHA